MFLTAVFDGVFFGTSFAPQIGLLLGFVSPESVDDPFWNSPPVRAVEIGSLVLTLAAVAMMIFGFSKCHLIRYRVAET
jgi:hypothetical protein